MAFWDLLRGELIDIIEWRNDGRDLLVWRFPRHDHEIKNGAQLIVREGQQAVLVDQGEVADTFGPGRYELITNNLPVLSKLKGWKYGFQSPFKCEVYFVSTRQFTDKKWGTKNPIMLRDPEFGPVRLRAFGTYTFRAGDPVRLIRDIVGSDSHFASGDIQNQLRNILVARFADSLGECRVPMLDLAANYNELGERLRHHIAPEFSEYGLELTKLLIENVSLPPEVEAALDKRSSMGIIGDTQGFQAYQRGIAIEKAAENPGGAGQAMAMGMGFQMANQAAPAPGSTPAGPPPIPGTAPVYAAIGGQQAGPFDAQTLRGQVQSGRITRDTLVWRQGMGGWTRAGDVDDLKPLFDQAPPPLPPGGTGGGAGGPPPVPGA